MIVLKKYPAKKITYRNTKFLIRLEYIYYNHYLATNNCRLFFYNKDIAKCMSNRIKIKQRIADTTIAICNVIKN